MPITYATPEPFAPGISSAYGAAQQYSQDAPSVIGAASRAAGLRADAQARAEQLQFAYAQANAQSQDRRAALYTQSEMANADRQQQSLNLGAQLTQRNDEATFEGQARMAQQAQHADLQNWLGQQDLSQKEAMRLQRMKAAVDDVMASNLTPEQKQDAIVQLRTGIDPLEQRLKTSQAKMATAHAQAYQQQAEMDAIKTKKMAEVNKLTASERIHDALTTEAQAEIDSMNLTPMQRDAAIKEAKRQGKFDRFTIDPDGSLTPVVRKEGQGDPAEKAFESSMKHYEIALAGSLKHHEAYQRIADRIRSELSKDIDKTPEQKEVEVEARMKSYPKPGPLPLPPQRGGASVATPPPGETTPPPPPAEETGFQQKIQALSARTDLPANVRTPIVMDMTAAATMLTRAGGPASLTEPEKEFIAQTIKLYNDLPKAPPAAAKPAPPPGQPQQANTAFGAPRLPGGYWGRVANWLGNKPLTTPFR